MAYLFRNDYDGSAFPVQQISVVCCASSECDVNSRKKRKDCYNLSLFIDFVPFLGSISSYNNKTTRKEKCHNSLQL